MIQIDKKEIEDLFENIVKDGSNIRDDDDEEYKDKGLVPFESKLVDINEKLSQIPINEKFMPKSELLDGLFSTEETKPKKEPEIKIDPNFEQEKNKQQQEIVENVSVVKEEVKLASNEVRPISNEGWLLVSPSAKFNNLYEEKKYLLNNELLKGGKIDFEKYYIELENANVDTNVPTYDSEEIGKRIALVQQWRERIKQIQLKTNSQYFIWKEFMELLPSVLARVEYERGKQEGLFFEHFKDMISYWGHLQGLMKSSEIVTKHLDGAYASLSRQIVIAQPIQNVDNFVSSSNSELKKPSPQLSRYDSLKQLRKDTTKVVESSKNGPQEIDF